MGSAEPVHIDTGDDQYQGAGTDGADGGGFVGVVDEGDRGGVGFTHHVTEHPEPFEAAAALVVSRPSQTGVSRRAAASSDRQRYPDRVARPPQSDSFSASHLNVAGAHWS